MLPSLRPRCCPWRAREGSGDTGGVREARSPHRHVLPARLRPRDRVDRVLAVALLLPRPHRRFLSLPVEGAGSRLLRFRRRWTGVGAAPADRPHGVLEATPRGAAHGHLRDPGGHSRLAVAAHPQLGGLRADPRSHRRVADDRRGRGVLRARAQPGRRLCDRGGGGARRLHRLVRGARRRPRRIHGRLQANKRRARLAAAGIGLIGGVYFPIAVLPGGLKFLASILPFTWALDLLRSALLNGEAHVGRLMALLAFDALALPAALVLFRAALQRARRTGTLAGY